MKKVLTLMCAAAAAINLLSPTYGDLIVEYDGVAGTSIAGVTGDLASAGLALTRGAGIAETAGGNFNSNGFNSGTLAEAIAADEFLSFGFTPSEPIDLTNILVELDRSGSGPTSVFLLSSIGGFIDGSEIASATPPDPGAILEFDVSSLTNIASPTEFRFYFTGASSTAGTTDIEDDLIEGGSGAVGLRVNGVAAVPEPSTIALLGLVGLAGAVRRRK